MQDIVFYAAANETLGVVRDYANARNQSAPVLTLGVSVCLRIRLFAESEGAAPYPLSSFNGITDWKWRMDGDFDRSTMCKLVADDGISVHTVTDTVNGETRSFTEFVIPISNMNTQELSDWLGTEKTRSGLTGELVGYDADDNAAFVLQIENFSVRNRVAGLGNPTAINHEYVTHDQTELMIQTEVSSSAATKQDKLTAANGGTGISVSDAGIISVSDIPQSAVTGLSASLAGVSSSLAGKQDLIAAGDLVEISGTTVNRRRYMTIRQSSDMDTVSKIPTGGTVNRTYRIMAPGNAYKLTAVSTDLYLATEEAFLSGGSLQWGIEGHLELFVAGTGRVHTDDNVILADALKPDSVNYCTVRFRNGRAVISVEDHLAGQIVTVNASTDAEGTLKHYLQLAPAADATYNETQYIAFDATLNGQVFDLGCAVTNGEKHVVGNGFPDTIISGGISCTSKTTFSNLGMTGVSVLGGTMTLGDVYIPNGATVGISGGGLAVEKVTGDGTIDFGGTNVVLSPGATAYVSGCTLRGGLATGSLFERQNGGFFFVSSGASLSAVDCRMQNGRAIRGGMIFTQGGANVRLVSCTLTGGTANAGAGVAAYGGMLFFSACTFSEEAGYADDVQVRSRGIMSATDCSFLGATGITIADGGGSAVFEGMTRITKLSGLNSSCYVTISSGAIIELTSSIVALGRITIPAGAVVTVIGSGGSSGYFSDLAVTGTTITNLGRIYGATVTVPPLEDPIGPRGPWILETTEGETSVSAVSGESRQIVVSGGLCGIIGM